jgi:hypothetical protein
MYLNPMNMVADVLLFSFLILYALSVYPKKSFCLSVELGWGST